MLHKGTNPACLHSFSWQNPIQSAIWWNPWGHGTLSQSHTTDSSWVEMSKREDITDLATDEAPNEEQ